MKRQPALLIFLCLVILAACTLPAPVSPTGTPPTNATKAPVQTSVPTQAKASPTNPAQASATAASTQKSTPAPSKISPTAITAKPTLAPTKAPGNTPTKAPTRAPTLAPTTSSSSMPQVADAISILSPGLTSNIISPIKISGQADSTFEQNLIAKVTGENGLSVGMKSTTIQSELGKRGPFSVDVTFKITKDQPGRVAVWSSSPKDGGLVHFSSIEVNLKASGTATIVAGKDQFEAIVITQPAAAASVSGGKLHVQGWSAPVFENSLVVVLCGEGGTGKSDPFCGTADNILARMSTIMKAPDVGQPGQFNLDVTYKVTKPISGRVAVYCTSPRDGGLLHLSSVPVQLNP
jgi:hypothetical protein